MIDDLVRTAATLLITCVPLLLILLAIRARSARMRRAQVRWLRSQVDRAMDQLASASGDEVLSGLQTIAFLNDPMLRLLARPTVEQLTRSEDLRVASQAQATLGRWDAAIEVVGQRPD